MGMAIHENFFSKFFHNEIKSNENFPDYGIHVQLALLTKYTAFSYVVPLTMHTIVYGFNYRYNFPSDMVMCHQYM